MTTIKFLIEFYNGKMPPYPLRGPEGRPRDMFRLHVRGIPRSNYCAPEGYSFYFLVHCMQLRNDSENGLHPSTPRRGPGDR